MSSAVSQFLARAPSDFDRMQVARGGGAHPVYVFPTAEDDAREAARRAEHAAAWNAAQAEQDREKAIAERVKAFVGSPPADDGSARGRLAVHVEWLAQARIMAGTAEHRKAQAVEAVAALADAQAAMERVQTGVRSAHEQWIRFGDTAPRPDSRSDELAALKAVIESASPLARIADQATLESDVGNACVRGLEAMLPLRRAETLIEECGPAPVARYQAAVAEMKAALCDLASLDEATTLDWLEMSALGISRPDPLLIRDATLVLPRVANVGPSKTSIAADPTLVSQFQARLTEPTAPPAKRSIGDRARALVRKLP